MARRIYLQHAHTADVRGIDWHRVDGDILIASADWSGRVRLWHQDGRPIREIRAHDNVIWSVRFSPQGDRLLTACADGTARIWPVRLEVAGRPSKPPLSR
jgi:WD40 repeat protein